MIAWRRRQVMVRRCGRCEGDNSPDQKRLNQHRDTAKDVSASHPKCLELDISVSYTYTPFKSSRLVNLADKCSRLEAHNTICRPNEGEYLNDLGYNSRRADSQNMTWSASILSGNKSNIVSLWQGEPVSNQAMQAINEYLQRSRQVLQ